MPLTTTGANFSSPVPTTAFFPGFTVPVDGRSNSSSRTTPLTGSMTVTMVTNETGFNSTKLPEVVASGSGMGMVLVPFGIITIIGLAVVMVSGPLCVCRLEKLRHQLMPMYNFDPAEEQDELEQELLDHSREGAGAPGGSKALTPSQGTTQKPSRLVFTDVANAINA
ncbi:hypothetical protein GN956_G5205 [Arapaima gigas]